MGWLEDLERKHQEEQTKETIERETAKVRQVEWQHAAEIAYEQSLITENIEEEKKYAIMSANVAAYGEALRAAGIQLKELGKRLQNVKVDVKVSSSESREKFIFKVVDKHIEERMFTSSPEGIKASYQERQARFPTDQLYTDKTIQQVPTVSITYFESGVQEAKIDLTISKTAQNRIDISYFAIRPNNPEFLSRIISGTFHPDPNYKSDLNVPIIHNKFVKDSSGKGVALADFPTKETATRVSEFRDIDPREFTQKNLEHFLKWVVELGMPPMLGERRQVDIEAERRRWDEAGKVAQAEAVRKQKIANEELKRTAKGWLRDSKRYLPWAIVAFLIWLFFPWVGGLFLTLVVIAFILFEVIVI